MEVNKIGLKVLSSCYIDSTREIFIYIREDLLCKGNFYQNPQYLNESMSYNLIWI